MLDGNPANVKIPALKSTNQLIRLAGQGVYDGPTAEERNDLFLRLQIAIPTNISEEHKTIIERLATLYGNEEFIKL